MASGKAHKKSIFDKRIIEKINDIQRKEKERQKYFGKISPIIHTDFKEHKFVVVGNEIHFSKKWRTFPDFLKTYIWNVLGKQWFEEERKKTFSEKHQIFKWYDELINFQKNQKADADGIFRVIPNGAFSAFVLLSYDLYLIRNNQKLQKYVIKRLKNREQFQGARYELFVTAACIRAGFDISYEDEKNYSKKHAEFIATHKETGQKLSIEAKSKHRQGILGMPGKRILDEKIKIGKVVQLINQALKKKSDYPLVILVDVNLPPEYADEILGGKFITKFPKLLDNIKQDESGKDIFNIIIFTNHPHHYGREDEPDPKRMYSIARSLKPIIRPKHPKAIDDLLIGILQYGRIPNDFPENDRVIE